MSRGIDVCRKRRWNILFLLFIDFVQLSIEASCNKNNSLRKMTKSSRSTYVHNHRDKIKCTTLSPVRGMCTKPPSYACMCFCENPLGSWNVPLWCGRQVGSLWGLYPGLSSGRNYIHPSSNKQSQYCLLQWIHRCSWMVPAPGTHHTMQRVVSNLSGHSVCVCTGWSHAKPYLVLLFFLILKSEHSLNPQLGKQKTKQKEFSPAVHCFAGCIL